MYASISFADVIMRSACYLFESAAVGIDFVKVEVFRTTLAVGKYNLIAVIMHLRIADCALGVVQQYGHLAGSEIQFAQPAHCPVRLAVRVVCIISEIGIPVAVGVQLTAGKNDFVHARHRPVKEFF